MAGRAGTRAQPLITDPTKNGAPPSGRAPFFVVGPSGPPTFGADNAVIPRFGAGETSSFDRHAQLTHG
jgi:hypothetical protein